MKLPVPTEDDQFTVYTANWCPSCSKAKTYLENSSFQVKYYNIEDYGTVQDGIKALRKHSKSMKKQTTIPIIFYRNILIGGYQELKTFCYYV